MSSLWVSGRMCLPGRVLRWCWVRRTMTDITDRARKPLVDRAKDWAADAQVAHTYGVGIRADLSTIAMVRELADEVERLRAGRDVCATAHTDLSSLVDRLSEQRDQANAALERVRELAERWRTENTWDGQPAMVARAFGLELQEALEVPDDRT